MLTVRMRPLRLSTTYSIRRRESTVIPSGVSNVARFPLLSSFPRLPGFPATVSVRPSMFGWTRRMTWLSVSATYRLPSPKGGLSTHRSEGFANRALARYRLSACSFGPAPANVDTRCSGSVRLMARMTLFPESARYSTPSCTAMPFGPRNRASIAGPSWSPATPKPANDETNVKFRCSARLPGSSARTLLFPVSATYTVPPAPTATPHGYSNRPRPLYPSFTPGTPSPASVLVAACALQSGSMTSAIPTRWRSSGGAVDRIVAGSGRGRTVSPATRGSAERSAGAPLAASERQRSCRPTSSVSRATRVAWTSASSSGCALGGTTPKAPCAVGTVAPGVRQPSCETWCRRLRCDPGPTRLSTSFGLLFDTWWSSTGPPRGVPGHVRGSR